MTNPIFKNKLIGALLIAALSLSACAKKTGSSVRVAGRNAQSGVAAAEVAQSGTCSAEDLGRIYDPSYSSAFESQVKGFVSATMDPLNLGSISGSLTANTGVQFTATFQFDSAGKIVADASAVHMIIFDSYVGQVYEGEVIEPFDVSFGAAVDGSLDRNTRQFRVVFEDGFGKLVFEGTYDNIAAQGVVSYQNYTAVNGYAPATGNLGAFRISACAIVK